MSHLSDDKTVAKMGHPVLCPYGLRGDGEDEDCGGRGFAAREGLLAEEEREEGAGGEGH